MQDGAPYKVVILGGGTSGWIAAARIAAGNAPQDGHNVSVTLVESPTVGPIGVGEGTWPTMRNTLSKIGMREADFIRAADATFKQGACFAGWRSGAHDDAYYHPLNPPVGGDPVDMSGFWESWHRGGQMKAYARSVDFQSALCDSGLAPKTHETSDYSGIANYAYHLDASKFAVLLRDHATKHLGVRHVIDDVIDVTQKEDGSICALKGQHAGAIKGDFFIDCSGFAGRLIGGVYGVGHQSCKDVLFADRALALQLPYDDPSAPIACHTISTAKEAGWIWDIGLWSRRGLGYVYSSAHSSDAAAEETLRRYAGAAADELEIRHLAINAGRRRSFWQKNCVAIGLSSGFIEPLEASSLVLVELAVNMIADRLPRTQAAMVQSAKQFNAAFDHHWDRVIEFLKLHYVLTQRRDSEFWIDNANERYFPDGLKERLELWRELPPGPQDFAHAPEIFSWPSYQYILFGMSFDTKYGSNWPQAAHYVPAQRAFERNARLTRQLLNELPEHRALLSALRNEASYAA